MDKIQNLKEKADSFKTILKKHAEQDSDAERLLGWLTPLFISIENGQVIPPYTYEYSMALGKEADFYERHKDIFSTESDFICALEDWESQDWYKSLSG